MYATRDADFDLNAPSAAGRPAGEGYAGTSEHHQQVLRELLLGILGMVRHYIRFVLRREFAPTRRVEFE